MTEGSCVQMFAGDCEGTQDGGRQMRVSRRTERVRRTCMLVGHPGGRGQTSAPRPIPRGIELPIGVLVLGLAILAFLYLP